MLGLGLDPPHQEEKSIYQKKTGLTAGLFFFSRELGKSLVVGHDGEKPIVPGLPGQPHQLVGRANPDKSFQGHDREEQGHQEDAYLCSRLHLSSPRFLSFHPYIRTRPAFGFLFFLRSNSFPGARSVPGGVLSRLLPGCARQAAPPQQAAKRLGRHPAPRGGESSSGKTHPRFNKKEACPIKSFPMFLYASFSTPKGVCKAYCFKSHKAKEEFNEIHPLENCISIWNPHPCLPTSPFPGNEAG
jgi:hypothetical protein